MSSDDPSRRDVLVATTVAAALTVGGVALTPTTARGSTTRRPVADGVIRRLLDHGVDTMFGVPGATCAALFDAAVAADMRVVVTSSDLEAGYAAEAWGRVRGLSAVCVSYGVGTMGLLSVVAGAYAERVPMLILNGGPTGKDLKLQAEHGTLYSHSADKENADLAVFREVTAAAIRADSAAQVPDRLEEAIRTALAERRPVYLEIAKHAFWGHMDVPDASLWPQPDSTDDDAWIGEAIHKRLAAAERPLVLVGAEVQRRGLEQRVETWLKKSQLPWASSLLAKSILDERTPGFIGVYLGGNSVPAVKQAVENSDCVLAIGTIMGRQFRNLVTKRRTALIRLERGHVRMRTEPPKRAALAGVLSALEAKDWTAKAWAPTLTDRSFNARRASVPARALTEVQKAEVGLHYEEVMHAVSEMLSERFVAIGDTSLSMYPAAELDTKGRGAFVCNGVWQAIGYSVPAALGVGLAGPRRPIAICGDGGFQMTCMALSTLAREKVRAIVIVLDNALYGIEQWLLRRGWHSEARPSEPLPYLTLPRWDYDLVGRGMGMHWARTVDSPAELRRALSDAVTADGPVLITARIRAHDLPAELKG